MPIYVYKCEDCETEQDEIHPMAGPDRELACQNCGSKRLSKQITRANGYVAGTDTPTHS